MTTFAKPAPTPGAPTDALAFVRKYRHHRDCRCNQWRDDEGAGYCCAAEALWTRALNRLLDECVPVKHE